MTKKNENQAEIAGRHYQTEDFEKKDQISSGFAETHEQVSDHFFEGTVDQLINNQENKTE
ncbi:DUF4025 domain-containing protein [Peribacillus sp. JNUCC 23]|uniref:DUF4025 domain-containing protein n=1 Tax=Peribacillus loiseleuriae TaxID=1679170 RepID=A0A0K9GUS8_9BACI|nr:YozQ family protein [Peribacillus loiseleuriae]KMY50401.1 hypothetical protein AC625_13560 [Peribacillus loiseleuriae]